MTDELKYDPELPFALVRIKADGEAYPLGVVEARTRLREDANDLADTYEGGWVKVIDTTPKPKIPEGAEFIIWNDGAYLPQIAQRDSGPANLGWRYGAEDDYRWYSPEALSREIGDAEVTVLVRKEDS